LIVCLKAQIDSEGHLSFAVPIYDGKMTKDIRICEGSFLHIINVVPYSLNASSATSQWKMLLAEFRNPELVENKDVKKQFANDLKKAGIKFETAKKFITNLAKFYGDYFATEQGVDAGGNVNDKTILPHYNNTSVYHVSLAFVHISRIFVT